MARPKKKSLSGRKPVIRALPPLAETCLSFKGFQEGEGRTERIFTTLQAAIQNCRRSEPQPFYAMREVAAFFGSSLCTVSKVYHRLDRLGMLTRHRSSQTMIPARAPRTRVSVRGVVCFPIWLPGFLQFLDWRRFFSGLEEDLSRYRFVLEPVFYSNEKRELLVERMLKFNPDYLIWNHPVRTDLSAIQSLADTGVSIITIRSSPGEYPGRTYHHSHERGLRQGLKAWEADGGIDRIVVPEINNSRNSSAMLFLKSALKDCALPHQFFTYQDDADLSAANYLKRLKLRPRTGIIFYDFPLYVNLCTERPAEMYELIRKYRVMVMYRSTMRLRSDIPAEVTVDTVLFPWQRLARRIASDLNQGKGMLPEAGAIFEAEWRPRMPLGEIVQRHLSE